MLNLGDPAKISVEVKVKSILNGNTDVDLNFSYSVTTGLIDIKIKEDVYTLKIVELDKILKMLRFMNG